LKAGGAIEGPRFLKTPNHGNAVGRPGTMTSPPAAK
jgi:hypothetical protein